MNVYFLVEGKTERKVYPELLSVLVPQLTRVKFFDKVEQNNYFLFSSGGFPHILEHLVNAIEEINTSEKYKYLVLCLDADEVDVKERKEEVSTYLNEKEVTLQNSELKVVVQNRCLETWFLGNRKVYPRAPQREEMMNYANFYNVSTNDPEMMGIYPGFNTYSSFHFEYLRVMLLEKNIRYSKRYPRGVTEASYVRELIKRVNDSEGHIKSFKNFFDFCVKIKKEIKNI